MVGRKEPVVKFGAALVGAATMALTLVACGSGPSAAGTSCTRAAGVPATWRVGFSGDAPWTILKEDGSMSGLDGEILGEAAKRMCAQVQGVHMDFSAEIGAVQSGRIDIMAGGPIWTDKRAQVLQMTFPTYFEGGDAFVQKKDNNYTTLNDLRGQTIGDIQGYADVPELLAVKDKYGFSLKLYNTVNDAVQDVANGRIAVFLIDPMSGQWIAVKRPDLNLKIIEVPPTSDLSISQSQNPGILGMGKCQVQFRKALDTTLKQMHSDSTIASILAKYGYTPRSIWDIPADYTWPPGSYPTCS